MPEGFGDIIEKLRRATVQVRPHRSGGGSGVIWSRDGQIITNAHVVEGASESVQIELWDGRRFTGEVVKRDRRRDLASLQLKTAGLPSALAGDSRKLRVGELVIAVGNPLGFIGAASTGVVHQVDHQSWVISDVRLAPGNSGGPLANAQGEVVGINTMIGGGLAFAVPSRAVAKFLSGPSVDDMGLGVVVRPVLVSQSPPQLGLIVLQVNAQSPAHRASLLQGDILLGAGGKRFDTIQDLELAIEASRGKVLELQFRRGPTDSVRTVAVQMAAASMRAA